MTRVFGKFVSEFVNEEDDPFGAGDADCSATFSSNKLDFALDFVDGEEARSETGDGG